ncbi:MAG TPA: hypothetical protein VMU84_14735, partial [Thermoanaerobaculia bacterium]|nr:hypothetical protein [Thermoanaerobaculia bacterium]
LAINSGGTLENSGTFNINGDVPITSDQIGNAIFKNLGAANLTKTAGTGFSQIFSKLDNLGIVNVTNGQMAWNGGGTNGGTINIPAATNILAIEDKTYSFSLGTTTAGGNLGFIRVDGTNAVLSISGVTALDYVELKNGKIVSANFQFTKLLKWTGGTLQGPGTFTVPNTGQVDHLAPTMLTTLDNATFTNNGLFNYDPGSFNLELKNSATFSNTASGTFDIQGDRFITSGAGTNVFNNSGMLKKSIGASGTRIDVPVNNTGGTISANSAGGTIILANGGSMTTGTITTTTATSLVHFFGGTFTVSGGGFSGTGKIEAVGTATLQINANVNALTTFDLAATGATLSVSSPNTFQIQTFAWTAGTIQGSGVVRVFSTTIGNTSPTTLTGSVTFTNAGTLNYNADATNFLTVSSTANLNNESSSTFSMTADGIIQAGGSATMSNMGTLKKTGGGGFSKIFLPLTHTLGSLGAVSGTLEFNGATTLSAQLDTGAASILRFTGSVTHNINAGASVIGTGAFELISGTTNFNTALTIPYLAIFGGNVGGTGAILLNGGQWDAGNMSGAGTTTINSGASFNITNSTLRQVARAIVNNGTILDQANGFALDFVAGGLMTNNNIFESQLAAGANCTSCNTPAIVNSATGTFRRNGIGSATFMPIVNNDGIVDVQAGNLALPAFGASHTGSFTVAAGTRIEFGDSTFSAASSIGGTGEVWFLGTLTTDVNGSYALTGNARTLVFNGTTNFNCAAPGASTPVLVSFGSTLGGTGDFTITGNATPSTIDSANINGSGAFTIAPTATLDFTGSTGNMLIDSRTITNNGTLKVSSATFSLTLDSTASIVNNGLMSLISNGPINIGFNGGSVTNTATGTLKKSAGAATQTFGPNFSNAGLVDLQSGTLDFTTQYLQTNGTTKLNGGNLKSAFAINVNGGSVSGNGTIDASVSNNATFAPGDPATAGTIAITGTYTQTGSGTLNMKIGGAGAGQFDVLSLSSTPTLAGTFNETLINAFQPSNGQTFDVITWPSLPGTSFTTVNLPTFGVGGSLNDSYTPSAYRLTASVVQADIMASQSAPPSANHNQNTVITITVTNNGPDTASSVTLGGNYTNATFVSATSTVGTCTPGPVGQYTCSIGTLGSTASAVITLTLNANVLATITHNATASATTADPNAGNNATGTANITVNPTADLTIGITDAPDPVDASTNTTYTVTITNNGPDSASAVNVALSIVNASIVSATSGTFSCSGTGPSANCNAATLGAGSATITVVAQAPAGGGSMALNGTVSSSTFDNNNTNNNASENTTVTPKADLAIGKIAPLPTVVAGTNVTFTITVTNNGPSTAASVTVNDPTPAGATFVSTSGDCTTAFPCALGAILSGFTKTINATYAVPPNATGSIANTATVSSPTADPNGANNTAVASVNITQQADLAINKSGPATLGTSSTINYSITVTNIGPSDATGVTVDDPTPSRLTFVSNSGACTTPFPCAIGNLNAGQSVIINSSYTVGPGSSSITNTATVSSATSDPNAANNSDSVTTSPGCPTSPPIIIQPLDGASNVATTGQFAWSNANANSYNVYFGPAGSGCTTLFASTNFNTLAYSDLLPNSDYELRIEALRNSCPTRTSSCVHFHTATSCNATPPTLIAPANGSVVASPVTFTWSAVANATLYKVFASISGGAATEIGSTGATTLTASLPSNGPVTWFVVATVEGCPPLQSANGSFNHCSAPDRVIASVVGEATSGHTYNVEWDAIAGATRYEIDEASNPDFTGATTRSTTTLLSTYTHTADVATAFYYRVRAFNECNQGAGANSLTIRVVIIPLPPKNQSNPNVNVPAGSKQIVVQEVFFPGEPGQNLIFNASVDRPWLTVSPAQGPLPPEGVTLHVTGDPAQLPNGTFTGTVIVIISTPNNSGITTTASSTKSVPVSISLVTPVTPTNTFTTPPANAIIIPSVGHLDGVNSHWQSDIRLSNVGSFARQYQLTFTPGGGSTEIKQTTVDVEAGATTALDDIVRNWYGIGSLGDGANGVLEIHPISDQIAPKEIPSVDLATAVSSRTYNVATNGTLGQHIPGIAFSSFIGKALEGFAPVLSLQQIAQSAQFRTNVGLVEASGAPASVLVSVFNSAGAKLLELPFDLKAGEQRQLNGLLAQNNLTLTDARLEVRVTGGEGKVTAYASVVDNFTNDPLLVSPVEINSILGNKWVLPGVADLKNALANWQTDMRIFNAGTTPQSASLKFYPQNNGTPLSADVVLQPGEVRTLDNVLSTLFQTTNTGGAVHVSTQSASSLVVTGRTFNQTPTGTFGQFIPAVTTDEAAANGGRALQILQVEDSTRFRTNLGIAEVSGNPATVEVQVFLPDSKVIPTVQIPLQANEFRQFGIIRELGLGNIYNARISVRVIEGEGRVTAYGSVIDDETQDPTYVKAQ